MAPCEHEQRLGAYHDGELSPLDAAGLETHLEWCPTCRHELRRLRDMSRLLSEAVAAERAPDRAVQRWRKSVRPARDRTVLRTTQMLAAVAAAVLIFCAAALWQNWPSAGGGPSAVATWENAAVQTASPNIRTIAGQLTHEPGSAPDVQLVNSILADAPTGGSDKP